MNSLVFKDAGRIQEILINSAGAFIVQVGLRDFYAVEFALQHITNHNVYL